MAILLITLTLPCTLSLVVLLERKCKVKAASVIAAIALTEIILLNS